MTDKLCSCGRKIAKPYGGHRWCCIFCSRDGLHTYWCDRQQSLADSSEHGMLDAETPQGDAKDKPRSQEIFSDNSNVR